MTWRPMTEHVFPWPVSSVIVVALDKETPSNEPEIFRCRVGEHGALFPYAGMLSLHEQGWLPYAWREDDAPPPDNEKWPPMLTDYLTEWEEGQT